MRIFLIVISSITTIGMLLYILGAQINLTPSMPRGIYLTKGGDIQRGDYVGYCVSAEEKICLAQNYLKPGSCPSGLQPLLKIVVGLPGDNIQFTENGIYVNGRYMENSVPKNIDSQGRRITRFSGKGIVPDGYAVILSPHPSSFDSRYFGWAKLADMQKVIPVFTMPYKPPAMEAGIPINTHKG